MESANVFVVEDEAITSKMIQTKLIKQGYSIAGQALSANETLEKLNEVTPDLILMDIKLQGKMDGIELASEIRKNFKIPVVYLTANTDSDILARAKITQPYGYIVKPVNERELVSNIEMALYKHKAENEIKRLKGIIPICSHCKKIRGDENYWQNVTDFISTNSEAKFTHGICPNCMEEHYSDFMEKE